MSDESNPSKLVRINKLLSEKGIASRREVDSLIEQGRVKVNGIVLKTPGIKIDPGLDIVEVDSKPVPLSGETRHRYLILHKPAGYLCSRKSQGGIPTVYELPSLSGTGTNLKYAGRLDSETSGLLVMTTDGDFANQLTHPSFQLVKKYCASFRMRLSPEGLALLKDGFAGLEDGPIDFLKVKEVKSLRKTYYSYEVWITEGRNRIVRRIFEAVDRRVAYLERYALGDVTLDSLPLGKVRDLTQGEIKKLSHSK